MGLAPLFEEFFARVSISLDSRSLDRVRDAWHVAEAAHHGQLRQSGEPYVTHPLAVAGILVDRLEPDVDALCAALLHDVVEDTDVSLDDIETRFGGDVARIVDGVSKLDRAASGASGREETLRKLIGAGGRDWRVFAVKLCDRLHNMRTLGATSVSKQRRVARDTLDVFFPLARYVGFSGIARELEALCLRHLHPWRWHIVERWIGYKARVDRVRLGAVIREQLADIGCGGATALLSDQLDEAINGGFRSIREDRASRALFGLPKIHVICDSLSLAYERLGALHSTFVLVPASFAAEVGDGLLRTRVQLDRRGLVAEFFLWFPRVARASWSRAIVDESATEDFLAVAHEGAREGDFTRVLRNLVSGNTIEVFSPKGRRVALPPGSSALDFAFSIHTDVGLHAVSARVNGVLTSIGAEIRSGDIVEVVTDDAVHARAEWEAFLRSPRARSKLRLWLRDAARAEVVQLGRKLVEGALGEHDLDLSLASASGLATLQALGVAAPVDLFRLVGSGQVSAFVVASQLRGDDYHTVLRDTQGMDLRSHVILDGRDRAGFTYCARCLPLPGDDVVAVASVDGTTIHRVACDLSGEVRASMHTFIPYWADRLASPLAGDVLVSARDRKGLLADCATAISSANINVVGALSQSYLDPSGEHMASLRFTVLIAKRSALERCLRQIESVPGVARAVRAGPRAGAEATSPPV